MLCLRTARVPPHKFLHKIRRHTTRILHHILRDLQRLRQHILRPIHDLTEQAVPNLVARKISRTRCDSLHCAAVPYEPGQEERTTSLHNESTARKDEPDLCVLVGYADVHGERHCDADADSGPLKGADGGFATVEYGEGYAAATVRCQYVSLSSSKVRSCVPVPVVLDLLCILTICSLAEPIAL
jgi:hypothetical protein